MLPPVLILAFLIIAPAVISRFDMDDERRFRAGLYIQYSEGVDAYHDWIRCIPVKAETEGERKQGIELVKYFGGRNNELCK